MKKFNKNNNKYWQTTEGRDSFGLDKKEDHSQKEGMVFSDNNDNKDLKKMKDTKKAIRNIGIIEKVFGHKGTVMIRPLIDDIDEIKTIKNVYLVDKKTNTVLEKKIYDVRKYRRGRLLVKFAGLMWRDEVEGMEHCVIAA